MRIDLLTKGLLLGLCGIAISTTAVAEDLTVNRMLASQCAQCHGTDGYAVGDMDGLAHEGYREIYEELMEMQTDGRPNDIMEHQALGYTEDQIRRIAVYFEAIAGGSGGTGGSGGSGGSGDTGDTGGSGNSDGEGNESEHEHEHEHEKEKKVREKRSERSKKKRERSRESKRKEKERD